MITLRAMNKKIKPSNSSTNDEEVSTYNNCNPFLTKLTIFVSLSVIIAALFGIFLSPQNSEVYNVSNTLLEEFSEEIVNEITYQDNEIIPNSYNTTTTTSTTTTTTPTTTTTSTTTTTTPTTTTTSTTTTTTRTTTPTITTTTTITTSTTTSTTTTTTEDLWEIVHEIMDQMMTLNNFSHINCKEGWTGPLCELDIDDCVNNDCPTNTTCIDAGTNKYKCVCKEDTTCDGVVINYLK